VTRYAALTRIPTSENVVRRGADIPERRARVTDERMTTNARPDLKMSGPTAATAREAVLSWAEAQPRIRARATRARVSIHQTHLSYYQ